MEIGDAGMILVTGGAGFIGSNFVTQWITEEKGVVVNLDKLTHAGNLNNLTHLEHNPSHHFIKGDIRNRSLLKEILNKYQPRAIIHCAADTHLDRSVHHSESLIQTNIFGTYVLLEEALTYWKHLDAERQKQFRFVHLSTDEVFGSLLPESPPAVETTPYSPTSPYAASKASADHLVRSYYKTYGLPILIAHCSKNFGPYQFPEKLIPLTIVNALQGKPLQILGEGLNTCSWLYVGDHCHALRLVLARGTPGETYNIAGESELTTKDLVYSICHLLDELKPDSSHIPHTSLIKYVKERHGQDQRFVLDCTKIRQLGWLPKEKFEISLSKTIAWYLHNMSWIENIISGEYRDWIRTDFGANN